MSHVFHTTGHITSPWLPGVRLAAFLDRATGGRLTRILQWRQHVSGRVSVSPVSSEWLLEHEIRSTKHQENA
jgi:hypothetical protein